MLLSSDGKVSNYRNKQVDCRNANKNIEDAGLSDKIEIIIGNALDIIPKLDQNSN